MRAFKIRELYQLNGFRSAALGRSVRPRLQNLTIILERLCPEWKQGVGDQELAVRQGEKGELRRLIFRSGRGRLPQYQYSTHALCRSRQDRLDLPHARIVVAPECVEKFFHCLLSGTGRRKICRVDRRECRGRCRSCCRRCGWRRWGRRRLWDRSRRSGVLGNRRRRAGGRQNNKTKGCAKLHSIPLSLLKHLYLNFYGDGKTAPHAKRLAGDLEHRRCLLSFVLTALHQLDDMTDGCEIKMVFGRNLFRSFVPLNISLQNRIEHLVGRQRICILLPRTKLRGRRFLQDGCWNHLALTVHIVAKLIDLRLHNVADHRQRADHIPIERAVADRHLRLVAGGEHQRVEFVGKGHQKISPDARLNIFLSDVRFAAGKEWLERFGVLLKELVDGDGFVANSKVRRQRARVINRTCGGILARHSYRGDVLLAQRVHSNGSYQRGINTSAESNQSFGESTLAHIVPGAQDESLVNSRVLAGIDRPPVAGERRTVEIHQVFFKRARLGNDGPIGAERNAGSVKNQAVVATDLVNHDHRSMVPCCNGSQHPVAQLPLSPVVRRSGDVQDDGSTGTHQLLDGVHGVKTARPEQLVVPGVFTDGERKALVIQGVELLRLGWSKITLLIEDVIERQEPLGLDKLAPPIRPQASGIHDMLARVRGSFGYVAADDAQRRSNSGSSGNLRNSFTGS